MEGPGAGGETAFPKGNLPPYQIHASDVITLSSAFFVLLLLLSILVSLFSCLPTHLIYPLIMSTHLPFLGADGLGFKVEPRKGSAVLFYNLLEDGNGDDLSLHAALPVWKGEKWLANFWYVCYCSVFS